MRWLRKLYMPFILAPCKVMSIVLMAMGLIKGLVIGVIVLFMGHPFGLLHSIILACTFAIMLGTPFFVYGLLLYLKSKDKPDYWWPGQSQIESQILSTMPQKERVQLNQKGFWPALLILPAVFIPPLVYFSEYANPWFLAICICSISVGYLWGRDQRHRELCATPYAIANNIQPAHLRRFRWK